MPRHHPRTRVLVLSVLFLAGGCRTARIEPFGEAKLGALCADTKRCGARGDTVVNLLSKKAARMYLVPDKGPEQLLGKVAPKRDAGSVLKTCGAEIGPNDWLAAPEVVRSFTLGQEGKRALRERLQAYLGARIGELTIPASASAEASVRAVINAVDIAQVSWVGQTYWLSDAAFERRVGQCGEEERRDIIYSMTVLSPSQVFQADMQGKLVQAMSTHLGALPSPLDASVAAEESDGSTVPESTGVADGDDVVVQTYDTIARDVVRALARDTRVVAALGFDNP